MADKKSDRRFTLQFNKKDPAHSQVADILNRLEWRGKAQYVVNAVLHYINRSDSSEAQRPALDERHIEAVVSRMLQGLRESGTGTLSVPSPVGQVNDSSSSMLDSGDEIVYDDALESLGEGGYNAIAGALDMFRKK